MENETGFDFNKAKGSAVLLANQFIAQSPPMILHVENIYYWNGKYYEMLSNYRLIKLIYKFFEDNMIVPAFRSTKAEEMVKVLKYCTKVPEVEKVDDYPNLINLNNGVVNLDDYSFSPHDPSRFFTYVLDVDYDKEKTEHPHFTQFLQDIFRINKEKTDDSTILLLLQIFAYLIYPQNKVEELFIFLGGGANGKGVLIETIKMFFPNKYITSMGLHTLSNEDTFARNPLYYSRLNITTEQSVSNKISSEEIKKIVSGELVSIRHLHKESVAFEPKTKIVLAANDYPYFNDTSDGINRRIRIIEFKNKFVTKEKYDQEENPESKGIYLIKPKEELLDNIRKEKTAIFNTLLTCLDMLRKNEWQFPESENTKKITEEYQDGSDTMGAWLKENYVDMGADFEAHEMTAAIDILNDFKSYYDLNFPGRRFQYSVQSLGRKIKQIYRVSSHRASKYVYYNGASRQMKTAVYPVARKADLEEMLAKKNYRDPNHPPLIDKLNF